MGPQHDFPGVAIVVDVASPGQRLEADTQAAPGGKLAELTKIRRGAIDAAERAGGNIAAHEQQIGSQFLHQVQLAFGPRKIAGALRLGHALEIAKPLERANLNAEIAAEVSPLAPASGVRQPR